MKHTLVAKVMDQPGVLNRVASLFPSPLRSLGLPVEETPLSGEAANAKGDRAHAA